MSHIDLHPEDLIDKEITGELSLEEESRLRAHLQDCDACRFERVSRDDFRAEFVAQSQRVKIAGMVASVMLTTEKSAQPLPIKRLPSRAVRVAVMIAAALLIVGLATAAGWSVSKRDVQSALQEGETHRALVSQPEITQAPAPPSTIVAPIATLQPAPVASAPAPITSPPEPSAAAAFSEANLARERGDYATAIADYTRIDSKYAGTPEANVSLAILGKLLLDRGDASGALQRFDAYMKSGDDTLREEAMVGRANALEQLGRDQDAAAAWSAFVGAYPGSVHAAHAKSRLGALRP